MQTSVVSFGYKHGIPLDVDLVFDCRFLPNPFWVEELQPFGLDRPVRDYVLGQPESVGFLEKVDELLTSILPAFVREGKSTIAIGCTRQAPAPLADPGRRAGGPAERARPGGVRLSTGTSTGEPHLAVGGGDPGGGACRPWPLRALRRYAGTVTGVVSVADDGGSSGRLHTSC